MNSDFTKWMAEQQEKLAAVRARLELDSARDRVRQSRNGR